MNNIEIFIYTFIAALTGYMFIAELVIKKSKEWHYFVWAAGLALAYFLKDGYKEVVLVGFCLTVYEIVRKRKIKKLFIEWFPWAFLFLSFLYKDDFLLKTILVAGFIVFKTFSWPLNLTEKKEDAESEPFNTLFMFMLWSTSVNEKNLEWALAWLLVAIFYGFGSRLNQILVALGMSVVSLGHEYLIVALLLVSAVFIKQKFLFYVSILFIILSQLIFKESYAQEDLIRALAAMLAISLSRSTLIEMKKIEEVSRNQQILNIAFFTIFTVWAVFIMEDKLIEVSPTASIFVATGFLTLIANHFLFKKKPNLFSIPQGYMLFSNAHKKIVSTELFQLSKQYDEPMTERALIEKITELYKKPEILILAATIALLLTIWGNA